MCTNLYLQIPEAASSHHGVYSCNVEYAIPSLTETELIEQTTTVFINSPSNQGTVLWDWRILLALVHAVTQVL